MQGGQEITEIKMQKTIKISIITVCYNAVGTIEETIRSVVSQTYPNIEYIIVDGGSNDGTIDVIRKYSSMIVWLSEPDNGIYDAMNKGAALATGDFVLFLGADDTLYNEMVIENVAKKMSIIYVVYYGDVIMHPGEKKYWGRFNSIKLGIGNICHQAIFYPREIFSKYSFDTNYILYADYQLNILLYNKYKFEYINEVISYFNTAGISGRCEDKEFERDRNKLIKENLGWGALFARYVYHSLLDIRRSINKIARK